MIRLVAKWLARSVALAACVWLAGFAWFIYTASQPAPENVSGDGIVALTGGAERLETAFRLLAEGKASRLLLSGIGGGADLADLAHRAGFDPAPLAEKTTLGRQAETTKGNAQETADWVHQYTIHSLLVVTAGYHMKRAINELHRALPDVVLLPVPVVPAAMRGLGGFAEAHTLRLLGREYMKWLASEIGLSARPWARMPRPASHQTVNEARAG